MTRPKPLHPVHWWAPALALAAITCAVWIWDLDRTITAWVAHPGAPVNPFSAGWGDFWNWLYRWGAIPGIALTVGALLLQLRDPATRDGRYWRRMGLVALLAMLLGPMLITNVVLKEYYGRPRPREVVEFGGPKTFAPVLVPTFDRKANSFPSGHAAAGFSILPLYFMLRERHPRWGWAGLGAGLGHGSLMGWMRVLQGGHFFSDVVWAGAVTWFSALAVTAWLQRGQQRAVETPRPPEAPARKAVRQGLVLAIASGVLLVFVVRLPIRQSFTHSIALPPGTQQVALSVASQNADGGVQVHGTPGPEALLVTQINGRGLPWWRATDRLHVEPGADGVLQLSYAIVPGQGFGLFGTDTDLLLPPGVKGQAIRLDLAQWPNTGRPPSAPQGAP